MSLARRGRAVAGAALLAAQVSLAAAAHAEPAHADASAEAEARQRFKQGNKLIEQARYVDALDEFRAAYTVWQNPKIQLNIATTLRTLGRHAEALRAYRDYLRSANPTGARRGEVEVILADLEARVARVTLALDGDVARVTLDGDEVDREALGSADGLALDPGRHVLLADTAAGQRALTFEVNAGAREALELPAPAPDPKATIAQAPVVAPEDAGADGDRLRFGVTTRVDIDGKGRGAVGALGLAVPIGTRLVASAGALLGAHQGGWVGLEGLLLEGALTPTFGVSAPVFFVDGPRFGVSGELGGRWALLEERLFVMARVALVHFPKVPDGYANTNVVPSLGSELRW
ncbi:MAG TPA: tetratricopeptide repeat protein [Polyangiaceae bacterium]|nr:tetratricopeptide repeat protein [Polyangiaceae bacterium]